ncbi:MAG: hypothetical protein MHMPM18_000101 [Marteilia pararefringens]
MDPSVDETIYIEIMQPEENFRSLYDDSNDVDGQKNDFKCLKALCPLFIRNNIEALTIALKGNVGMSVLLLPYFYKTSGYVYCTLALLGITTILIILSDVIVMAISSLDSEESWSTFSALTVNYFSKLAIGRKYHNLINTIVSISGFCAQIAVCVSYSHLASTCIVNVLDIDDSSRKVYFYVSAGIVLVLHYFIISIFHTYSSQARISQLSFIFLLFSFSVILPQLQSEGRGQAFAKSHYAFRPGKMIFTLTALLFAFEGLGMVVPIAKTSKSLQDAKHVMWISFCTSFLIFSTIGCFVYYKFGEKIQVVFLTNLQQNVLVRLATVAYVIYVQFSFGLTYLVGHELLETFTDHVGRDASLRNKFNSTWSFQCKMLLNFLVMYIIIVFVPHIDTLICMIGAIFTLNLSFVIPIAMYMAKIYIGWAHYKNFWRDLDPNATDKSDFRLCVCLVLKLTSSMGLIALIEFLALRSIIDGIKDLLEKKFL